jgi:GT2 family glycosyltransferase
MIGAIVVTYAFYPEKLFESLASSKYPINWYIYFHGHDRDILARLTDYANLVDATFFPYCLDRGIARSWNEALIQSTRDGNSFHLLLNDDLFFYDGCFDQFVEFLVLQSTATPDFGFASAFGYEGAGPNKGQVLNQGFACGAIGRAAIEKAGFFDVNFWPAYFEDVDYARRVALLGLPVLSDNRTLVEHERMKTVRESPELADKHAEEFRINREYYERKWGGPRGHETFRRPFDDPRFDCRISVERILQPYGPDYDRVWSEEGFVTKPPPVRIVAPADWANVSRQPVIEIKSTEGGAFRVEFFEKEDYFTAPGHGPRVLSGNAQFDPTADLHRYTCERELAHGEYVYEVWDNSGKFRAHRGLVVTADERSRDGDLARPIRQDAPSLRPEAGFPSAPVTIGVILITYAFYPEKLFQSLAASRYPIKWYIYFHGHDQTILARLAAYVKSADAAFFPYCADRGVARSWNDGINQSMNDGNSATLLLNDDLSFYPNCFDKFVEFVIAESEKSPDFSMISAFGHEAAGPHEGQDLDQRFGCCAIGKAAMEKVGYFDDNFFPAYFEDIDYFRRIQLVGLPIISDNRVLAEHERMKTMRLSPELAAAQVDDFNANQDYYIRKWGGGMGQEAFAAPFNNLAFDYYIGRDRIRHSYGTPYDRARPEDRIRPPYDWAPPEEDHAAEPPATMIVSPADWETVGTRPVIEIQSSDEGPFALEFFREEEYHTVPGHGRLVLSGITEFEPSVGLHRYTCERELEYGRYVFDVRDSAGEFVAHSGIVVDIHAHGGENYEDWIELDDARSTAERPLLVEHVNQMRYKPTFLILVETHTGGLISTSVRSVENQLYPHWGAHLIHFKDWSDARLLPAGDFVIPLRAGDILHPEALYEFASALNASPDWDLIYADEDRLSATGERQDPYRKRDWNPDDLGTFNYLGYPVCVRMTLAERWLGTGGYYDFVLRMTGTTRSICHLRKVLCHRSLSSCF